MRQLGERVAAWKVTTIDGALVRGAILASRYFDTPASVPGSIKRWIRAHVAQLFNNPEAGAEGLQPMPLVDRLLDPYCIHEVAQ